MLDLPNRRSGMTADAGCDGHCGGCRWYQTDPDAADGREHIGLCLHEELAHFSLQVTADSGCNRFQPAAVAAGTPG